MCMLFSLPDGATSTQLRAPENNVPGTQNSATPACDRGDGDYVLTRSFCRRGIWSRGAAGAGERVSDQAIHQFGIGYTACLECQRIHADVGEPRNGVHLIDEDAHIRQEEEVDSRHRLAAERTECPQ